MTPLEYIGLGIAALAGGISAWLMKVYKMGRYLDEPLDAPINPVEKEPPPNTPPAATTSPAVAFATESTPIPPTKATIANFCLGLREYEGWILPSGKDWSGKVYPTGSQSYRNNNPGNVRFYSGGYLPKYLPVLKSKNNFAIFKDYATGWLYLTEMVKAKIRTRPNQTLLQFMEVYAPYSDDNNPLEYATFLAKRLGVDISTKMSTLV